MGGDHASPRKSNTDLMGQARAEVKSLFSFFRFFGLDALNAKAESHTKRGC